MHIVIVVPFLFKRLIFIKSAIVALSSLILECNRFGKRAFPFHVTASPFITSVFLFVLTSFFFDAIL